MINQCNNNNNDEEVNQQHHHQEEEEEKEKEEKQQQQQQLQQKKIDDEGCLLWLKEREIALLWRLLKYGSTFTLSLLLLSYCYFVEDSPSSSLINSISEAVVFQSMLDALSCFCYLFMCKFMYLNIEFEKEKYSDFIHNFHKLLNILNCFDNNRLQIITIAINSYFVLGCVYSNIVLLSTISTTEFKQLSQGMDSEFSVIETIITCVVTLLLRNYLCDGNHHSAVIPMLGFFVAIFSLYILQENCWTVYLYHEIMNVQNLSLVNCCTATCKISVLLLSSEAYVLITRSIFYTDKTYLTLLNHVKTLLLS